MAAMDAEIEAAEERMRNYEEIEELRQEQKQKRNRQAEKEMGTKAIRLASQVHVPNVADNAEPSELMLFVEMAKKKCKVPDLKALYKANHLMVSGNKAELLKRLAHCKCHGRPGKRPKCRNARLRFGYDDETDLLALSTTHQMQLCPISV